MGNAEKERIGKDKIAVHDSFWKKNIRASAGYKEKPSRLVINPSKTWDQFKISAKSKSFKRKLPKAPHLEHFNIRNLL